MKNANILKELKIIRKEAESIIKKIDLLEKDLNTNLALSSTDNANVVISKQSMKEKFKDYLQNVVKVSAVSIDDYIRDLKRIKLLIKKYLNINLPCEILEIDDLTFMKKLTNDLYDNLDFKKENKRSHYHYSAPLNNYLGFLSYCNNSFEFED